MQEETEVGVLPIGCHDEGGADGIDVAHAAAHFVDGPRRRRLDQVLYQEDRDAPAGGELGQGAEDAPEVGIFVIIDAGCADVGTGRVDDDEFDVAAALQGLGEDLELGEAERS